MKKDLFLGAVPNLILISVDSFRFGDIGGRFYTMYDEAPAEYRSLMELLQKVDAKYDQWLFPESALRIRTFFRNHDRLPERRSLRPLADTAVTDQRFDLSDIKGQLGTFLLTTEFRQNASWQGSLLLKETGGERSFGSVGEMIFHLEDMLSSYTGDRDEISWNSEA